MISLDPYWEYEITPYQLACIASQICHNFGSEQYQVIYAVHEDTPRLHVHILVNTVGLTDGKVFTSNPVSFYSLLDYVEFILREYHLWYGSRALKLFR